MYVNIDEWIEGYKVKAFNWIDRNHIYINIQYYKSGSSLSQPPAMEKSVLVVDNDGAKRVFENLLHTLVVRIATSNIKKVDDNLPIITLE